MAIRRCLIAFALLASAASAAAQDKDKLGKLQFSSCQGCHIVGDKTKWKKSGPHLNELFGRKPGSLPEYTYSLAMVEFGKDHVWDEATLTAFLRDPPSVVPGSSMKFTGGLKTDEQLLALLAYLATFDKDGMASN